MLGSLYTISISVVEAGVGPSQCFFEICINGIYLTSSFQTYCPLIHYMQQLNS